MLFQNDQGGKVLEDIYVPMFKKKGIEYRLDYFEPGTKDFSAVLAKVAAWKPDFSSRATPTPISTISCGRRRRRPAHEVLPRAWIPRTRPEEQGRHRGVHRVHPKYFEEAEKKDPKVAKFIKAYKDFYKRDFPYDQAPSARPPATTTSTCSSRR